MTEVPDYVPMLIKGVSEDPKQGGCVVQIANWLYDPTLWTDEPQCVSYLLAHCAISINDLLDDDHRHQLALLAPRLSGTHLTDEVTMSIGEWIDEHPQPYRMGMAKRQIQRTPDGEVWVLGHPEYELTTTQQGAVDWLTALLDEYDRLTGRTTEPLPVEKWDEIRELLGQK